MALTKHFFGIMICTPAGLTLAKYILHVSRNGRNDFAQRTP